MTYIDILIAAVLVLIMFGIGVSLSLAEVKEVFSKPKALLISLLSQMIFLPLLAFSICLIFDIPFYIQMGLIILAASPGGSTSGFMTYLFKGNVALSIVLTTINSLLTLFSIPIIINLALQFFLGERATLQLPILQSMIEIFTLTAIPASLGILFRHKKTQLATKIIRYIKPISTILLGIVFTMKFFGGKEEGAIQKSEILEILPYALLLNVMCFIIGFAVTRLNKLGKKNEITISIESAVHNTTIAFLVSGTLLQKPEFGKVALVYAMFSFWTALLFCFILIKSHRTTDL